jgi:heme-degrading monooxygenase HmoA
MARAPVEHKDKEEYLDIAAHLRPLLDKIDGFIPIERFESLSNAGKILSLSFWHDERAIEEWRLMGWQERV